MRVAQPKLARIPIRFTEVSRTRRKFVARYATMLRSAEANPHILTSLRPETKVSVRSVPSPPPSSKLGDGVANRSRVLPKAASVHSRIPDSHRSGFRESRPSAQGVACTAGEPAVLLSRAAPVALAPPVTPVARRPDQYRSWRAPRFQGFTQLMSPLQLPPFPAANCSLLPWALSPSRSSVPRCSLRSAGSFPSASKLAFVLASVRVRRGDSQRRLPRTSLRRFLCAGLPPRRFSFAPSRHRFPLGAFSAFSRGVTRSRLCPPPKWRRPTGRDFRSLSEFRDRAARFP